MVFSLADAEQWWLDHGRDLRLARLAVDGAGADAAQAAARPNPTLSWNGSAISTHGVPQDRHVDQVLRIDQTIERGDKRAWRRRGAQALAEAAQADLGDARRQGLAAVRAAHADLMLAEQRLSVFELADASYRRSLAAAERRMQAGDLARADLARLTVEALRAQADTQQAAAERQRASRALADLLAIEGDGLLQTQGDWPTADGVSAAAAAFERRPDVISAERAREAADANWQLARAQRVHDLTVGLQAEHYPGPAGTGNTVGIGVSVPLFWGDDHTAAIRRAEADRDAAAARADKARALAASEGARALDALALARLRDGAFRGDLIAAAEQADQAAEYAYSRGAIAVMELMDARRTLLAVRLDALQAHADLAKALAAMQAAQTRTTDIR